MTTPASPINIELDKILFKLASTEFHNGKKLANGIDPGTAKTAIDEAKAQIQALINQAVVDELEDILVKLAIAVGGANPVTNVVADRLAELRGSGVQNPTHNGDGEAS